MFSTLQKKGNVETKRCIYYLDVINTCNSILCGSDTERIKVIFNIKFFSLHIRKNIFLIKTSCLYLFMIAFRMFHSLTLHNSFCQLS